VSFTDVDERKLAYSCILVPVDAVSVILPYRPHIPGFVAKEVPLLKLALDVNESDGTVTSAIQTVKNALGEYLVNTYGMSPLYTYETPISNGWG